MVVTAQWRSLEFFEKEKIPETDLEWLPELNHTAVTSSRSFLFFGDKTGRIHVINNNLKLVFDWTAFNIKVTYLKHIKQKNLLISIGEDELKNQIIKIWDMDKIDKTNKMPTLSRSTKILSGNKPFPLTCVAVLQNLTQIAIGFENGLVVLLRGDIGRNRFTKQKIIHEASSCITGLGFREDDQKNVSLYVVTLSEIMIVDSSGKEANKRILDNHGSAFGCAIVTNNEIEQEMVIGRKEAIIYYGPEGRGPCAIIDSEKSFLTWYRHYLIVVSTQSNINHSEASLDSNDFFSEVSDGTVLTVYDLKSKYIAYSGAFSDTAGAETKKRPLHISAIIGDWGDLLVITQDCKMYRLIEKDLSTKLEMLFRKNLYPLAISIVTSIQSLIPSSSKSVIGSAISHDIDINDACDFDYGTLVEIFRRYGDWLYCKGDYDSAMTQYLRTVGKLEPSYVIRKFLDAQRIHNLTSYLSLLHDKGLGNSDHTTLLLNCYTKLKDVNMLDKFIRSSSPSEWSFDVEAAIKVCRSAGYFKNALYLAEHFLLRELYLKIQIKDLQNYSDAIEYISKLEPSIAEKELKKYGYALINENPVEMAYVLILLCTKNELIYPEGFIHLFVDQPSWCVTFLEKVLEKRWGVVLPSRDKGKKGSICVSDTDIITCIDYKDNEKESASCTCICNSLLELYLSEIRRKPGDADEFTKVSMDLLQNQRALYDIDHALVLCNNHQFDAGVVLLYEKLGLYNDILKFYMKKQDYPKIIEACKSFGDKDSSLWVSTLSYFAEKDALEATNKHSDDSPHHLLQQVLENIDKMQLLSPIQCLQALSQNSAVTVGMIKEYLIKSVESEKKITEEDEDLIKSYEAETEKMKTHLNHLKNSPTTFQATKCDICTRPLELPTVHFLCKHSFHQRCVLEGDQCPICSPEYETIKEMIQNQDEIKNNHDLFLNQLKEKSMDERFGFITDYFSKNVFNTV